jgi:hypothetical protein
MEPEAPCIATSGSRRPGAALRARHSGARTLGLAAVVATCGCGLQSPVLRYPWLEDGSLSLERQQVVVSVEPQRVVVVVRFDFRADGALRDRGLLFPIAPPCGDVQSFSARLAGPEREPELLETLPADPGLLPEGQARQAFEIVLPGAALMQHDGVLLVRYAHRCPTEIRYPLSAGAYWHGPVARLDVLVRDSSGRVRDARLDDAPPQSVRAGRLRWAFEEIEPSGWLVVALGDGAPPAEAP